MGSRTSSAYARALYANMRDFFVQELDKLAISKSDTNRNLTSFTIPAFYLNPFALQFPLTY